MREAIVVSPAGSAAAGTRACSACEQLVRQLPSPGSQFGAYAMGVYRHVGSNAQRGSSPLHCQGRADCSYLVRAASSTFTFMSERPANEAAMCADDKVALVTQPLGVDTSAARHEPPSR